MTHNITWANPRCNLPFAPSRLGDVHVPCPVRSTTPFPAVPLLVPLSSALAHFRAPRRSTFAALAPASRERLTPRLARCASNIHSHHSAPSKRCPASAVPPCSLWSDCGTQSSGFTSRQGGSPPGCVGALSMSGGGTGEGSKAAGGGKTKEAAEGDEKKDIVPWVSWVSLAMLLLVYISNQWTRSLVYCEL